MGDKVAAKQRVQGSGHPGGPGLRRRRSTSAEEAAPIAEEIGYPVLIKAAAGGGGRGMKVVARADELAEAMALARTEAKAAFGNDELYLEKYLGAAAPHRDAGAGRQPRQRRASGRARLLAAAPPPEGAGGGAVAGAQTAGPRTRSAGWQPRRCARIGYRSVGTIEFLYEDGEFYFIEMNTRLQVEHPVTEMICGVDLVREQIRIAAGAPLGFGQEDIRFTGHAIECRINAENPETFVPCAGPHRRVPRAGRPRRARRFGALCRLPRSRPTTTA